MDKLSELQLKEGNFPLQKLNITDDIEEW